MKCTTSAPVSTDMSCHSAEMKEWSGGKKKGPRSCVFLMAIQLLSSQRKAGSLDAILGVDMQDNRVGWSGLLDLTPLMCGPC